MDWSLFRPEKLQRCPQNALRRLSANKMSWMDFVTRLQSIARRQATSLTHLLIASTSNWQQTREECQLCAIYGLTRSQKMKQLKCICSRSQSSLNYSNSLKTWLSTRSMKVQHIQWAFKSPRRRCPTSWPRARHRIQLECWLILKEEDSHQPVQVPIISLRMVKTRNLCVKSPLLKRKWQPNAVPVPQKGPTRW